MKATATNQTISWFYQRYKEEISLELSPSFQRNPVWNQIQKEYLIETILLELPVPEIYYVNRITPQGESKFIVVDGQQRIRTILEFIDEELILKNEINGIKKFTDLPETGRQRFFRYPVVVRDLEDSTDEQVRDLFQRLNKYAVSLTDQELRNARFKGQYLKTVEIIGANEFWATSGVFSPNDFRRMLDLDYIGILLSTIIGGIFNRKVRLDEFYINYEEEFDDSSIYIEKFKTLLNIMETLFPELKKTRWRNKANFYTLFLVLDELAIPQDNLDLIAQLRPILTQFLVKVDEAKNLEEGEIEKEFLDYHDATTVGTNSKENRIRRSQILLKYIQDNLN